MPAPPPPEHWNFATAQIRRTRLMVGLAVLLVLAGIVSAQLLSLTYTQRVTVTGALVELTGNPPLNMVVGTDNAWTITALNRDGQPHQVRIHFEWTRADGTTVAVGWVRMLEGGLDLVAAAAGPDTLTFETAISPLIPTGATHIFTVTVLPTVIAAWDVTWEAHGPPP